MVNETAPISENSYIEDTAETPVEDAAIEEVDSVEETEDTEVADVLDEIEYATKEELEKIRPMLGRYTKTLDQLQAKTADFVSRDEASALREELSQIRDLLELGLQETASEDVLAKVRSARSDIDKRNDRETLRQELLDELGQGSASGATQANTSNEEITAASRTVIAYAKGKGLAAEDIPASVWDIKQGQTLEEAIAAAESAIDDVMAEAARGARRNKKKSADTPNNESPAPAASGTSYKGLTLEKLSKMSRDEISSLPKEVVDKVLASPS